MPPIVTSEEQDVYQLNDTDTLSDRLSPPCALQATSQTYNRRMEESRTLLSTCNKRKDLPSSPHKPISAIKSITNHLAAAVSPRAGVHQRAKLTTRPGINELERRIVFRLSNKRIQRKHDIFLLYVKSARPRSSFIPRLGGLHGTPKRF